MLLLSPVFILGKPEPKKNIISCEIMGGLGNQLFQIATTLSTAWDYGYDPIFPQLASSPSYLTSRPVYWNTVFRNIKTQADHLFENYQNYYEQNEKVFSPIILENSSIKLMGYWQSEKYFHKHRNLLLSTFQLPSNLQIDVDNRFHELIQEHKGPIISLHLRLGDYVTIEGLMCLWKNEFKHYYMKALSYFPENSLFMIFSDDSVYARQFCAENLPDKKTVFPKENDFIELYLMAKCDHNIIANSTFSWWGAYLNTNPNKIVISPKEWTTNSSGGVYFQDYLPNDWIAISVLDH